MNLLSEKSIQILQLMSINKKKKISQKTIFYIIQQDIESIIQEFQQSNTKLFYAFMFNLIIKELNQHNINNVPLKYHNFYSFVKQNIITNLNNQQCEYEVIEKEDNEKKVYKDKNVDNKFVNDIENLFKTQSKK